MDSLPTPARLPRPIPSTVQEFIPGTDIQVTHYECELIIAYAQAGLSPREAVTNAKTIVFQMLYSDSWKPGNFDAVKSALTKVNGSNPEANVTTPDHRQKYKVTFISDGNEYTCEAYRVSGGFVTCENVSNDLVSRFLGSTITQWEPIIS